VQDDDGQTRDESLFLRFRNGDDDALRELFERYRGRLDALVRRRLPRPVQRRISVADVLQEARVAALRNRFDFEDRGAGSFRRWLFGIAENKTKEAIRNQAAARRATGREISRAYRPETAQLRSTQPSPSEVASAGETAARIKAALASLPDDYRTVLQLTRGEGLTLREAAARMGRSREAAKKLYGRAFVRFKATFTALGSAGG
jgi:RNA polymerase sigma-70 factor (ECF subfamily)